MANKKSASSNEEKFNAQSFKRPEASSGKNGKPSVRSYSGELPEQAKLEEGDIIAGVFSGMKVITIKDQNTKEDKDVRVYSFRDANDNKFAILGRTMLDTAFDNCAEHEGGFENMHGLVVEISRKKDTGLKGGRTLGNYEVVCWEAE